MSWPMPLLQVRDRGGVGKQAAADMRSRCCCLGVERACTADQPWVRPGPENLETPGVDGAVASLDLKPPGFG